MFLLVVPGRHTHDPVFEQKLTIPVPKAYDADVRFALYDADQDDRLEDAELVGEALVKASVLAKANGNSNGDGGALSLPLTKEGKAVTDAFLVLNGQTSKSQLPVTKFDVSVAARSVDFDLTWCCTHLCLMDDGFSGFPILSDYDALIAASVLTADERLQAVGQTERIP